MQHTLLVANFDLARSDAHTPRAVHQVSDLRRVFRREEIFQPVGAINRIHAKQTLQRAIHSLNAAVGGQRDDAGRDTLQNRFGESPPVLELAAVRLQVERHLIEGANQRREFVDRADLHLRAEVTFADLLAAPSSAVIGTLICLARNSASHVAKNRMNSVIRTSSCR